MIPDFILYLLSLLALLVLIVAVALQQVRGALLVLCVLGMGVFFTMALWFARTGLTVLFGH